jgi:hypothetical protein
MFTLESGILRRWGAQAGIGFVDLHRAIRWAALVVALVYLTMFVARGWIPHDEGTLGQNAERVLAGQLPHVDFNEPYTGGLSFVYASVFLVAGVDLLHLRQLLLAVAMGTTVGVYLVARRFWSTPGAVGAAGVALVWSFPNYFAGLPSWWLLAAAVWAAWCLCRYLETGRLAFAAAAGLTVGCGLVVKQTGVYLVAGVVMALLTIRWRGDATTSATHAPAWLRVGTATIVVAGVVALMGARLRVAEVLYLLLPLVAVAVAMCRHPQLGRPDLRAAWPAYWPESVP